MENNIVSMFGVQALRAWLETYRLFVVDALCDAYSKLEAYRSWICERRSYTEVIRSGRRSTQILYLSEVEAPDCRNTMLQVKILHSKCYWNIKRLESKYAYQKYQK